MPPARNIPVQRAAPAARTDLRAVPILDDERVPDGEEVPDGGRARGVLERRLELTAISEAIGAARAGCGKVVLIDGAAGSGKSSLLGLARGLAERWGVPVFEAAGVELERDCPFGVATQLIPYDVGAGNPPSTPASAYRTIRHMYEALRALADEHRTSGLVVLVDDLHWADSESVRFIAYVGRRAHALPLTLILATRSGHRPRDREATAALRRAASDRVLRPGALSRDSVAEMMHRRVPGASDQIIDEVFRVTGGNPFLLDTVLVELAAGDPSLETPLDIDRVTSVRTADWVDEWLRAASSDAREIAKAVAVLADAATLSRAAAVAELSVDAALLAADELVTLQMLRAASTPSFVQPAVRAAILQAAPIFEASGLHGRAARVLAESGARATEVAPHLLLATPAHEPAVVEVLMSAAGSARRSGEPSLAVGLLMRALAERPSPEREVELLAELGSVEDELGIEGAGARYAQARAISVDPRQRGSLALAEAMTLRSNGRDEAAASLLEGAIDELVIDEHSLHQQLRAAYVAVASLSADSRPRLSRLRVKMVDALSAEPEPVERLALAHIALRDSLSGSPRPRVREHAEAAWGDGLLMAVESTVRPSWPLVAAALFFTDDVEFLELICSAVERSGVGAATSLQDRLVSCCRAAALYTQGDVAAARSAAWATLNVPGPLRPEIAAVARAVLAACQIEQGQLSEAAATVGRLQRIGTTRWGLGTSLALQVRSQLRLAENRPQEALDDAYALADADPAIHDIAPGAIPWRSHAALAHLALGERERARALADEELARAEHTGATRLVVRNLRILGLTHANPAGLELLEQATRCAGPDVPRLEHMRALVDFGAALRRANRRADARVPLREARESCRRLGATALAERARVELVAAGGRPRRAATTGIESLTASQSRVAGLAAQGLTTRQIAESLFVTPKTVEFHLRQVYRKLGVSSRHQVAEALQYS
jgi:DNA-binding CsgD family transcriptional regulator